jgi:SAM-dependent methyltransferase
MAEDRQDYRAIVRAGYDVVSDRYLAERPADGADVAMLDGLFMRLPQQARVLDAGCGAGVPVMSHLVERKIETIGLDFSAAQLALARDRVPGARAVQGDLAVLPFPDASFDAVVSYYAVIHVPRTEHASVFAEVHRVLRPGGLTLLCLGAQDNPGDHDPESWLGTPMYWSHFDAETNRTLLRTARLEIIDDRVIADPMGHQGHLFVLARRAIETG